MKSWAIKVTELRIGNILKSYSIPTVFSQKAFFRTLLTTTTKNTESPLALSPFISPFLTLPPCPTAESDIFRFLWPENSAEHSEGAETEDPGCKDLASPIATSRVETASRCFISRAHSGFLGLHPPAS